jgi:uncharacterized protein (DUF1015 family)
MVRIFRFSAVRPDQDAASRVAAVPYDVVTRTEAETIVRDNPMSFLRISRPDADHPLLPLHGPEEYARARYRFDALLAAGVLRTDDSPGMYIYRVRSPAGTFTGLCCCLLVDDYESGVIRRHEQTRYDKEEDRTRHIDAVNAHTGPVVLIYRDAEAISKTVESLADTLPPASEVLWKDGSCHQLFRVTDPDVLSLLEGLFSSVPRLYIADGHHRAKSAVNVAKMRRAAGGGTAEAGRFMGVLFAHDGVRIHGYSRLVRDLGGCTEMQFKDALAESFSVFPYSNVDRASFQITPRNSSAPGHVMHMYLDQSWYECWASCNPSSDLIESLDVSILQKEVLDRILDIRDPRTDMRLQYLGGARPVADLEAMVDRGEYAVAFSLQPIPVETVLSIADANGIMPPKSTWFEPKLLSGLVIHRLG